MKRAVFSSTPVIIFLVAISAGLGLAAGANASVRREGPLAQSQIPKYIVQAVASPNRPAADRELDPSRKPEQIMAFFGIKPGMRVADLWAGAGYTSEVLARIVGPTGKVYSQNMPLPPRFKKAEEAWKARTKEPGMSNLVETTSSFDSADFLPVPAGSLDAVIIYMSYHDLVGRGFSRTNVNDAVYKALKPGGIYGVVDNSARPGTGASDAATLHRIDESFETREIEKAGFRLVATSDVLRNPKDKRTGLVFKMHHMQDRFVLKFEKPS